MVAIDDLKVFLMAVDNSFPIPLAQKQNLVALAEKFKDKADLCYVKEKDQIMALVAGYTKNVTDNMGYISVVATLPVARGRGYATKLVKEFVELAAKKRLDAVHLYTDRSNYAAINMYQKIGFEEWLCENEPRPDDLHLIYRIDTEGCV